MENTTEINEKIARNLIYYRKEAGFTQAELAEKINYSDKSVSKWEQGNALPDIYILMKLAKLYNITLSQLVGEEPPPPPAPSKKKTGLHVFIMLLSCGIVWLVATLSFALLQLLSPGGAWWIVFVCALPICAILLIVYASVWKYRALHVISVSALIWTAITCVYLILSNACAFKGGWVIFLVGVPLQILEVFWASFRTLFRRWKTGMMERRQSVSTQDSGAETEKKE